jgi:hypothetical protein
MPIMEGKDEPLFNYIPEGDVVIRLTYSPPTPPLPFIIYNIHNMVENCPDWSNFQHILHICIKVV